MLHENALKNRMRSVANYWWQVQTANTVCKQLKYIYISWICIWIHIYTHTKHAVYFPYTRVCIETIGLVKYVMKRMEIKDKVENKVKQERHLA